MRRVWITRIALGLALLIVLKIGRDFYKHYYYSDDIPRVGEFLKVLRGSKNWDLQRVRAVVQGDSFQRKLMPRLRVAAFVVTLWIVLFWAAAILIYEYLLHFLYHSTRPNRFAPYVWLRRLILTAAAAGILCIFYGFFIEPYWLDVTHLRLESAKLPRGANVRIAMFSDLHMGRKFRLEPKLPEVIAAEKPDLIVFTGDAMNTSWALGWFKQFLLRLHDVAPVIVVRGNQDSGPYWIPRDIFGGTKVEELDNRELTVEVRGTPISFWGQPFDPLRLAQLPESPPAGTFRILLHHAPDLMPAAVAAGFDLYLAGHTHGGQVALPFYGALITYSNFDKKYESGMYREGGTTLYVNRGIGFAKWPQPEARFFSRPEVTIIDLVGQ